MNIDWAELKKQKQTLLNIMDRDNVTVEEENDLTGILNVLDYVQDEAATLIGETAVFGY